MNFYEFIGAFIGDGSIIYNPPRTYRVEFAGNAKEQKDYFLKISNLLYKLTKKRPLTRIKKEKLGESLRLEFNNKKFVEYLINEIKIKFKNKSHNTEIPKQFLQWKYSKHIIRGIFETDGSLYFSKSKKFKYPTYPRIEIKTCSEKLLNQIKNILKQKDFKVTSNSVVSDTTIRLYLSGPMMLKKWVNEIGFSTEKNLTKYLLWRRLGYYKPKITLRSRLWLLKGSVVESGKASACRAEDCGFKLAEGSKLWL